MTADSMILASFISGMLNHMWQTTVFVGVVGALVLVMRRNRAGVRHAMWCIASAKFIVPFSLLVEVGRSLEWPASRPMALPALQTIAFPTLIPAAVESPGPQVLTLLVLIAGSIWIMGFAMLALGWLRTWRRARKTIRSATRRTLQIPAGLPGFAEVRHSRDVTTPAVFGILRPTLIVPVDIEARLSPREWAAIVTHEVAHIQRRDNLTTAFHAFLTAVFWFHPFVWWIGRALVRERERACDEAALDRGFEPHVFAEGLMKVCRSAVSVPAGCVAGAYSSDLKQRIEGIMTYPNVRRLHPLLRMTIGLLAVAAVLGPVTVGLSAPTVGAPGAWTPVQEDAYTERWLGEVSMIIQPVERLAFDSLETDQQRFEFIEEFWQRRDPTPFTIRNEFQEELYRRIAFANETFGSTVPGSETDRGRIYISLGPPDRIESQRGGVAGPPVPSEQWHYSLAEGIGQNVVIGFVDPDRSGEYRLATGPDELAQ